MRTGVGSVWIGGLLLVLACGPEVVPAANDDTTGDDDGTAPETTSPTPDSTSAPSSSSTSSAPAMSSSTADDGCAADASDGCAPDLGAFECSVDAQDCPSGWKCVAYSRDGDPPWLDTRCVPLSPDPAETGEPCTIVGSPYSGEDDCAIDAVCVVADLAALTGICAPFCVFVERPCPSGLECTARSLGFYVCLEPCDPLAQDCPLGQACYPFEPENGRFNCLPHVGGAFGIPCEIHSDCGPGLYCDRPEHVPGCAGEFCCTAYCDASIFDPSSSCPGVDAGQVCDNWYCNGGPEPALDDLGLCGVWTCN